MTKIKKKVLLSKIEKREDALKLIKDASTGFFLVAGLMVVVAFILDLWLLVDASIYFFGGFFLRHYKSRAAAVMLLFFAIVSAGFTFINFPAARFSGGSNIIIELIILWAAIRAAEATFKLQGRFASEANESETSNH